MTDSLAEIRAQMSEDGRIVRAEILKGMPMLKESELCARIAGVVPENARLMVEGWVTEQKIFRLLVDDQPVYPAFQFSEARDPRPVVQQAIACLVPIYSPWDLATWFWSSNGWLGGKSPFEWIETNPAKVLHAAEQELADC